MSKIRIDVGGKVFSTSLKTLSRYPGTTLSNAVSPFNDSDESKELYFDRNPDVFETVLDYYRLGELHVPRNVCGKLVRKELEYWGINENEISSCCWRSFYTTDDCEEALRDIVQFEDEWSYTINEKSAKAKIWQFLNAPASSNHAKIWSILYLMLLVSSVFVFNLSTMASMRDNKTEAELQKVFSKKNFTNDKIAIHFTKVLPLWMILFFTGCQVVFTLDFIARFFTCPDKGRFFKQAVNIVDLIVIPAFWSAAAMYMYPEMLFNDYFFALFIVAESTSVLRLLRFFRAGMQSSQFRILMLSIRASKNELFLLVFSICVAASIFARLIYLCELPHPQTMPDMFNCLWWAVITMTTVGYGDHYPKSAQGKAVGAVCALTGVLILSLPVAIVAGNFGNRYAFQKDRQRRRRKERGKRDIRETISFTRDDTY